jgi:hypothetical protein
MATNDRIHRRALGGIGEYNTYRTPEGGTVRSSIHGGERVLRGASLAGRRAVDRRVAGRRAPVWEGS